MSKFEEVIKSKERKCFYFKPNRSFYNEVKINQKRLGKIYSGEISATVAEAKAVAAFFEVDVLRFF